MNGNSKQKCNFVKEFGLYLNVKSLWKNKRIFISQLKFCNWKFEKIINFLKKFCFTKNINNLW